MKAYGLQLYLGKQTAPTDRRWYDQADHAHVGTNQSRAKNKVRHHQHSTERQAVRAAIRKEFNHAEI